MRCGVFVRKSDGVVTGTWRGGAAAIPAPPVSDPTEFHELMRTPEEPILPGAAKTSLLVPKA